MKRKGKTLAELPRLKSNAEAERFVADSDLTQYALSTLKPMQFEFAAKEARINMRLPGECVFRSMPAASSGACRAMIPVHVGPPFRSMPAGGCDAG